MWSEQLFHFMIIYNYDYTKLNVSPNSVCVYYLILVIYRQTD